MRLVFRSLAEEDLDAIDDWIAADNPARAVAIVAGIKQRCELLQRFPKVGRQRDDLRQGLRTISFDRRVLIAYRIVGDEIANLRVLWKGRDIERALRARPR